MLPVDVVFLHLRRSAATEHRIRERAEELAGLYPAISGCRVLVEVPHKHHTGGKRFRVRIELKMLRREDVVVERGPGGKGAAASADTRSVRKSDEVDAPFTDVALVIHDAFEVAKRRLHTIAERRRATARKRDVRAKTDAGRTPRAPKPARPRARRGSTD